MEQSVTSGAVVEVSEATMTIQLIAAFGTLILLTFVLYVVVARPRINQWGATDQEHQATWPGDQLVAQPSFVWTNAITIQAPGRAGLALAGAAWAGTRRSLQLRLAGEPHRLRRAQHRPDPPRVPAPCRSVTA